MANWRLGVGALTLVCFAGCGGATEHKGGAGGSKATSGGSGFGGASASGAGGSGSTKAAGGTPAFGGSAGAAGSEACDVFLACGCGCCTGTTSSTPTDCFYPEYDITRADVEAEDLRARANTSCSAAGCSFGRLYACCVSAPAESSSSWTYSASYSSDLGGSIQVRGEDDSGNCAHLELVPGVNTLPTLSSTNLRWNGQGNFAPCARSATPPPAIGIEGLVETIPTAQGCKLNVHVTMFIGMSGFQVLAVPIHAENLDAGLPDALCPDGI